MVILDKVDSTYTVRYMVPTYYTEGINKVDVSSQDIYVQPGQILGLMYDNRNPVPYDDNDDGTDVCPVSILQ